GGLAGWGGGRAASGRPGPPWSRPARGAGLRWGDRFSGWPMQHGPPREAGGARRPRLARIAVEAREALRRYAEPIERRKEPHREDGAYRLREEATARDLHLGRNDPDPTQTPQPPRQLDVLHQRLVRKSTGAMERLAPHEHRL